MVCCRPDISFSIGQLAKFMGNPGKAHWNVLKSLLKYLQHSKKLGLTFGLDRDEAKEFSNGKNPLSGYVDADFGGPLFILYYNIK